MENETNREQIRLIKLNDNGVNLLSRKSSTDTEYKNISSTYDLLQFLDLENTELKQLRVNFILNEGNCPKIIGNKGDIIVQKAYPDPDQIYKHHTHPYFEINQVEEQVAQPLKFGNKDELILIFSPHQDDEVLGASTIISKLSEEKINYKVIYMTSGKGGGDSNIRKQEAINGINVLGGNEDNTLFMNFPFYDKSNREVTDDDYLKMTNLLKDLKPAKIFLCSDVFDPNKTHRKCYDIIMKTINKDYDYYFYYSSWYWPKSNEFNFYVSYDVNHYTNKVV